MKNTERWLLLVVIILMFQITRNINLSIYAIILLSTYLGLYTTYFYESIKKEKKIQININILNLIYLFGSIIMPLLSLLYLNIDDYLVSLPRYLVTFPFIFFSLLYSNWNENLIQKIYKLYVSFIVLASLSVPYQILFGKIFFFADSSYREGLVRYSSLAGSLTALGTLGGYALTILLFDSNIYSKIKNQTFQLIIVLGMSMSLQKASIANILLVYIFYFLLKVKNRMQKIIFMGVFVAVCSVLLKYFFKNNILYIYIDKIVNYAFNSKSNVGTNQDLIDRIIKYPKIVFEYNQIQLKDLVFGIGFKSLSGTMGLSKYPMSHNNYMDLIFSSGLIFSCNYIFILMRCFIKKSSLLKKVLLTLILVNMLIGAATIYQPLSCIIIISIFIIYKKEKVMYV